MKIVLMMAVIFILVSLTIVSGCSSSPGIEDAFGPATFEDANNLQPPAKDDYLLKPPTKNEYIDPTPEPVDLTKFFPEE